MQDDMSDLDRRIVVFRYMDSLVCLYFPYGIICIPVHYYIWLGLILAIECWQSVNYVSSSQISRMCTTVHTFQLHQCSMYSCALQYMAWMLSVHAACMHSNQPHPPVNQVTKQLAMSVDWSVFLLALLGLGNCAIMHKF